MQVCVNTILYRRCLPGYFVMNTDFLTMVAIQVQPAIIIIIIAG